MALFSWASFCHIVSPLSDDAFQGSCSAADTAQHLDQDTFPKSASTTAFIAAESSCFQFPMKVLMKQTVVREKTLESPLDSEEIEPVNPKGNQSLNIH